MCTVLEPTTVGYLGNIRKCPVDAIRTVSQLYLPDAGIVNEDPAVWENEQLPYCGRMPAFIVIFPYTHGLLNSFTEKGIDSRVLVALTRQILNNPEFDEKYAETYRLEVSSPGIDMPLTKVRHFIKNIGRDIELKHNCKDQKDPLKGKIEDANDEELILAVRIKKENTSVSIPMKDVVSATLRLKW